MISYILRLVEIALLLSLAALNLTLNPFSPITPATAVAYGTIADTTSNCTGATCTACTIPE